METLLAWIKAIPAIIEIVSTITRLIQAEQDKGKGRAEAVAAGVAKANADIVLANGIADEADQQHAAHPNDDAGFDPDFRRD